MNLSMALRTNAPVSEFLPRYAEMVEAGIVFGVSFAATAATVASATATGPFALFNPANSGVQLVILSVNPGFTAFTTPSATTGFGVGLQFVPNQQPTTTSAGNTPQNTLIGSANVSKASVFTAGTLVGAPTAAGYLLESYYLDLAAADLITNQVEVAGDITVNPNSGIDIVVTSVTTVPTLTPSILWAEIPIS